MRKSIQRALAGSVLLVSMVGPAASVDFDSIKSQATESLGGSQSAPSASSANSALGGVGSLGSSLGLPSIGGNTASNAAGVLQYCVKNNYLGASSAASTKDKLLNKLDLGGTQAQQKDTGYQKGVGGILSGSDGSSFNLNSIKDNMKEKACDYVLENASSLL